jgi:hypothetical protein
MLEANSALTWRDVKHILVTTSDKVDASRTTSLGGITQYAWVQNAAGHEHHNWYGFGKINATAAVNAAASYSANSLGTFTNTGFLSETINAAIPDAAISTRSLNVTRPSGSNGIVEFVRISIAFDHASPWNLGFRLTSPSGTTLNIMQPQTNINNPTVTFDIGVAGFYGESMDGTWTLEYTDYYTGVTGTLTGWGIQIYGN